MIKLLKNNLFFYFYNFIKIYFFRNYNDLIYRVKYLYYIYIGVY